MDRFNKTLGTSRRCMSSWSSIQDSMYLNLLAKTNFDAVTLDMQHGMQTEDSVIRGIAVIAPTGKPVIVRIPVGRFNFASKALDAGAHGIIAPMINTVEDAKEFVSFTKYVTTGARSYGPTQAVGVLGTATPYDYVSRADECTKTFAMIETKQAINNMEAILDVDGIDAVFCGPADLSLSITGDLLPDAFGESTIGIIEDMVKAAHDRGKLAGTFCVTPDTAEIANKAGFDFIAMAFDSSYIAKGIDPMLDVLSFR